jgi:hypothetical protein
MDFLIDRISKSLISLSFEKEMTVFCHVCAEDIRHAFSRIKAKEIPDVGPLVVREVLIGYKKFNRGILDLGMPDFECSSPRHSRSSYVEFDDASSNLWRTLDAEASKYYKIDRELTELQDTTYQELIWYDPFSFFYVLFWKVVG